MSDMKAYRVDLKTQAVHEYVVDATSPESAIAIAETWYREGEDGKVFENIEFADADAYPIENKEDE
jgi:hypothetical protein